MTTGTAVRTMQQGSSAVGHWLTTYSVEVQGALDELGEMSPTQVAAVLGVELDENTAKGDVSGNGEKKKRADRMSALVDYLNSLPSDLRISQVKLEFGRLSFGTAWLPGPSDNFIGRVDCPQSVLYYIDQSPGKTFVPQFSRVERGALAMLGAALDVDQDEVLRRGLQLVLVQYREELVRFFGNSNARHRNAKHLFELARVHNVYWQEALAVIDTAMIDSANDQAVRDLPAYRR